MKALLWCYCLRKERPITKKLPWGCAIDGYDTVFRMAHALGVNIDNDERVCHGRWSYEVQPEHGLLPEYSESKTLAVINNTDCVQRTTVGIFNGTLDVQVEPFELKIYSEIE